MKKWQSKMLVAVMVITGATQMSTAQQDLVLKLLPGESWWGGAVGKGTQMPFGSEPFSMDLYGKSFGNQTVPLLISNKGRWIWSNEPFRFTFSKDSLVVTGRDVVQTGTNGTTLKDAYRHCSQAFFPTSGKWVDSLFVTAPQYNLWIEVIDYPTQEKVMRYAQDLLAHGYPPGILMIDNRWQTNNGSYRFDKEAFPDPKLMTDALHAMGFKVMVWVCPFITPDGKEYKEQALKKIMLLNNQGDKKKIWQNTREPYMLRWWVGYSGCLDLTNPKAEKWYLDKLKGVQEEYGIDGFKFDAGNSEFYKDPNIISYKPATANEQSELYGKIGLHFPLNEFRAIWKLAGQPLVMRLSDKGHSWKCIQQLIPNTIAQQMMGYTFTCPDMVGGGEAGSFDGRHNVDQLIFVRSAQCQALMPMIQFSAAPWRCLDAKHQAACKRAVDIRAYYKPVIMEAMNHAVETGEPALRPLEYNYPGQGYEHIHDQFMIGDKLLVAPIVTPNNTREVVLPVGKWKFNDKIIKGGKTLTYTVALDEILVFEKL